MTEFVQRKRRKPILNPLQTLIMEIIDLHVGEENKISRAELRRQLFAYGYGITDRNMRINIEFIRTNVPSGAFICSTVKGGYWKAKDLVELAAYCEQDAQRAKKILVRTSRQLKRATRAMTLDQFSLGKD
jgi:hypothetical protein